MAVRHVAQTQAHHRWSNHLVPVKPPVIVAGVCPFAESSTHIWQYRSPKTQSLSSTFSPIFTPFLSCQNRGSKFGAAFLAKGAEQYHFVPLSLYDTSFARPDIYTSQATSADTVQNSVIVSIMCTPDQNEKRPDVGVEEEGGPGSRRERVGSFDRLNDSSEAFLQNVTRVVRVSTWWALGAALLAIPLALSATVFSSTRIGKVRLLGLLVWLEMVWLALWVLYFLMWITGRVCHHLYRRVWYYLCRRYPLYRNNEGREDSLHEIHKPLTIWYHQRRPKYSNVGGWEDFLHDIRKPLTMWYRLYRPEDSNIKGWEDFPDGIHKPLTVWYRLCRRKYSNIEGWEDFLDDIHRPLTIFFLAIVCWASMPTLCLFDHDNCTAGWVGILRKVLLATLPVTSVILVKSVLIQTIVTKSAIELLRTRKEVEKRFKALTFLMGLIQPSCKESIWTTLGIPEKNDGFDFSKYRDSYQKKFGEINIAEQIEQPKGRLTKEELLEIFDEDHNGNISLDELMIGAYEIYLGRRDVENGINGIKNAAVSIDRAISGVTLIAMALIYSMYFYDLFVFLSQSSAEQF